MMRRLRFLAFAALAFLPTATLAVASLRAQEPDSVFANGGDHPLLRMSDETATEVLRLASSPLLMRDNPKADPSETVLLPTRFARPYSVEEAAFLREWVGEGGVLIVIDSFGQSNSLLGLFSLGVHRVRLVEQEPLMLARAAGRTVAISPVHPTAILLPNESGADVLASSSPRSFLDLDGNGLVDAGDPLGPHPVAARLSYGEKGGAILLIADEELISRGSAAENAVWLGILLSQELPGKRMVIDESRLPTQDPLLGTLAIVALGSQTQPWKAILISLGLVLLLATLAPGSPSAWVPHRYRPDRFVRRAWLDAFGRLQSRKAASQPKPGVQWTSKGTLALLGAAALALGAFALASAPAAHAAAILFVLLALAQTQRGPKIEVRRRLAMEEVPENATNRVDLQLEGRKARSPFEVLDVVPSEMDVRDGQNWFRVEPWGAVRFSTGYSVVPALRGPYRLGPLYLRYQDAFDLRSRTIRALHADELRVVPAARDVRKLPFATQVPRPTLGPHIVNRAGDGTEFHSLRGYLQGDSFRIVNWKASARSKDLVVNQRVHESMAQLTMFLDARGIAGAGPASKAPIAHGARVALSVCGAALRMRDRVRLFVYGDGLQRLEPAPASRQLHQIRQLLAQIQPAGTMTLKDATNTVMGELPPRTPVIIVSAFEGDATAPEACADLVAHGMLVTAVVLDVGVVPKHDDEGEREPQAEQILHARDELLHRLRGLGVRAYDASTTPDIDHLFRAGLP